MAASIEELRKEKERIEREREEIERRLQEAMRREREQVALELLPELLDLTNKIDTLKETRQQLLVRIREAAPRLGDFTYASEDYRLTLHSARLGFKQPELFDRMLSLLAGAHLHVEPRLPRFRLFKALHPVGTLHISSRRISIAAVDAVIDPAIIREAIALNEAFAGLVAIEYASEKKDRRVRATVPERLPNGDYALSMTFHANDTGTFDMVYPLALRALEHVATFRDHLTPDREAQLFEPWPADAEVAPAARVTAA
jgi:hypothetical protein